MNGEGGVNAEGVVNGGAYAVVVASVEQWRTDGGVHRTTAAATTRVVPLLEYCHYPYAATTSVLRLLRAQPLLPPPPLEYCRAPRTDDGTATTTATTSVLHHQRRTDDGVDLFVRRRSDGGEAALPLEYCHY